MSSSSWTVEFEAAVAPSRLFKAAVLDWHNLGPKIAPEMIVGGSIIEGDGNAGSIWQLNFTPALPFSHVKERFDFLDIEKCELKKTLIDGGEVGTKIETGKIHYKLEPTASDGSEVRVNAEYKLLPGIASDAVEIERAKGMIKKIFKDVEGYLLANPNAYA